MATNSTGTTLSAEQGVQLAQEAGFSGNSLETIVSIAYAESGLRSGAIGGPNSDGTFDYGVLQINTVHMGEAWPGGIMSVNQALDPATSFKFAYWLSKNGTNFGPWVTYNTGKYTQFLKVVEQAEVQLNIQPSNFAQTQNFTVQDQTPQAQLTQFLATGSITFDQTSSTTVSPASQSEALMALLSTENINFNTSVASNGSIVLTALPTSAANTTSGGFDKGKSTWDELGLTVHNTLVQYPGFYGIAAALDEAEQFPGLYNTNANPYVGGGLNPANAVYDWTTSIVGTIVGNTLPIVIRGALISLGIFMIMAFVWQMMKPAMEFLPELLAVAA